MFTPVLRARLLILSAIALTRAATLSDAQAAMIPLEATGWTHDLVVERTAGAAPFHSFAVELNPTENNAFYEAGLPGKSLGLPTSRTFTSILDGTTQFRLQPYNANNALLLSGSSGLNSGQITLTSPGAFQSVAVIAHSASGGGVSTVTLQFSDGTSFSTNYNASDWFFNSGAALEGFERINLTSGNTQGSPSNPRFYQTTIDLTEAGFASKTLTSLTFDRVIGAGATAVYAVSGEIAPQTAPAILSGPNDTSVLDGAPANFEVMANGNPVPFLQWFRNGTRIPGATNSSYQISGVIMDDDNAKFHAVASNTVNGTPRTATSRVATLRVMSDVTKPVLLQVRTRGLSEIVAEFSERIRLATATNRANYNLTGGGGVSIGIIAPDAGASNVMLRVSGLVHGTTYILSISNLADQSASANVIEPVSREFVASSFLRDEIGTPHPVGSVTVRADGYDIRAGGEIGGATDDFQFNYVQHTGSFDFEVRLASLSAAQAWSKAGLLAREDLSPGARSIAILATPSISGTFFLSRTNANTVSLTTGSHPVSYPETWLRLKRSGNQFTGYASSDGSRWVQIGTVNTVLPSTLFFGFGAASGDPAQTTMASFRDLAPVTNEVVVAPRKTERLGQSTRRTSLIFSEVMYHPRDPALEFIEILNTRAESQDLSGYRLDGSISYQFPPGTTIGGGSFLVVAKSPGALQTANGISGVLGPWLDELPNGNGEILLRNPSGAVFLNLEYSDGKPWPAAADGAGHSLVLARPSYGQNNPLAWSASDRMGGSPGQVETISNDPARLVVINEYLAHTDSPDIDYIELYNHSSAAVDVSGYALTDDPLTNKFLIPAGTILPARGFRSFNQSELGFALSSGGESIFFINGAKSRVLDAVAFGGQENGVSVGRSPDGAPEFYRLAAKSPASPNSAPRSEPVVINEVMYHPISENDDEQYVELHNRGSQPVDLSGWGLDDGISFTFPTGAILSANGFVVIARNRTHLLSQYPALPPSITYGDFDGRLSRSGERIALTKPDSALSTNSSGGVVTNSFSITVDEVTYGSGGRWPKWADGGGSSLELIDARSDRRSASNWADSDETQKAPWTLISKTGTLDHGNVEADQLQVLLQGSGECLIDNVEVLNSAGANLVANSTFEGGSQGWVAEGTQSQSNLENSEGFSSSRSFHIRAIERADNQVNRVRTALTSAPPAGSQNVTLRARVRWLKGHPEILLRLRGNWLDCAGDMALPVAPGSPGRANSRVAANVGPAISQVEHAPVLPANFQSVTVTARVNDPDGLASVDLMYRVDPATSLSSIPMNDQGVNGDAVAGDGLFSATVPGQTTGTTVAFHIQSRDGAAAIARFPVDDRECLIRFGEVQPTGNLPVYRIWMTQSTLSRWQSRPKLDNTPLDVTFVSGSDRVIYNATALYAGSPYISGGYSGPTSGRCGYSIEFPKDDLFLGDTDLVLDWPGGHGNESTAMQEQLGYWIAEKLNIPYSHRYWIRLHVNGVTDEARNTIFEAVLQPGSEFIEQWSPGAEDGKFYKIDRAFEFNDNGGLIADPQPRLENYTTTGGTKKTEKYRWNFAPRAMPRVFDYSEIFSLVDALNAPAPEPYVSSTFGQVDVEEWIRIFATEHFIVNFDAYGHLIGKNMYAYKPDGGLWQLYMFDLDWLILASQNFGYSPSSAPLFNSEDPVIARLYAYPPMARAYWRAVADAIEGPFDPAQFNAVMDAKYASLVANGVKWSDGSQLTPPTAVKSWMNQRRTFLQNQLATVSSPFTVNSSVIVSNGLGVLSGKAPVTAKSISVNGEEWRVQWNTVSNWTALVPLRSGANSFTVAALDAQGAMLPGASNTVSHMHGGPDFSPENQIVINEIMANPAAPGGDFVELFNASATTSFDLSHWNFNGLGYDFPAGSVLAPQQYLVLAQDRVAFNNTYGGGVTVYDVFRGGLQANGETLSLIANPGNPVESIVVDRVRYETNAPWPGAAVGASIQLIDPARDNSRSANWRVALTNAGPEWSYFSASGAATSSRLYIYLESAGEIFVDDVQLVAGLSPGVGPNLIANGGFENGLAGTWNLTGNFSQSTSSSAQKKSGNASLRLVAAAGGSGAGNAIYQDISPALINGENYSLSFWYRRGGNGGPLTVRLSGAGALRGTVDTALSALLAATPGAANSVRATLPEFPSLWLNEVQPQNLSGPQDNFGQRDPWVELHNSGNSALSLAGYYLTDQYSNLQKWAFPAGVSVPAGGFLVVWCDGQTSQTGSALHTSFRLAATSGNVALTRVVNGEAQVVDYLNYEAVPADWSYGGVPDAQPFFRQTMFHVTPGFPNNGASPPVRLLINEWMADNTRTLVDPADSGFEDWFEIYNPGTEPVDIGGFHLTDSLANPTKFTVPANGHYVVPAGGFLLVWADDEAAQNSTNLADLHANFALSRSGESIGLFAPDGTQLDAVTFSAQTNDVSEGRYRDGAAGIFRMSTPTPRAANVIPNTAPEIAVIPDRNIFVGQTLRFTIPASDAEQAAGTLSYALVSSAPSEASVEAGGEFRWTPTSGPVSQQFTVRVTDSGNPPLSAERAFTINVSAPPAMGVRVIDGQIELNWSGGMLQAADDVAGPYFNVTASPPYRVLPNAVKKFFRINYGP